MEVYPNNLRKWTQANGLDFKDNIVYHIWKYILTKHRPYKGLNVIRMALWSAFLHGKLSAKTFCACVP
jgi:hypothetical protein